MDNVEDGVPLSRAYLDGHPFQMCNASLAIYRSGFVYFLVSTRTRKYKYIGECQCIVSRLCRPNCGYESNFTAPTH